MNKWTYHGIFPVPCNAEQMPVEGPPPDKPRETLTPPGTVGVLPKGETDDGRGLHHQ